MGELFKVMAFSRGIDDTLGGVPVRRPLTYAICTPP